MDENRKKIMLVDDNQSDLLQGKQILKDLYEVYPLPSVDKLFSFLKQITPDLILLDIQMPGFDGYEAIKRLKAVSIYKRIPVIFLTASQDEESIQKGLGLGAVDFITKPFNASYLIARIEKCFFDMEHKDAHETNVTAPEASDGAGAAPEKKKQPPDAKPVILAVDDSPDILKTVHSILRDLYKVYTLPKPEKLEDILRDVTPDLFLLDYKMPGMSGFDLIPVIREHKDHAETPIIFLTSEGTLDHLTAAVGLGACDFIVKPFNRDVLHEKVDKHINANEHHHGRDA